MARMTVHMLGIMYFHVCEDNVCEGEARQVLLPDGTTGDGHVPAHHASIFIEESRFDKGDGEWPGVVLTRTVPLPGSNPDKVSMFEFRITDPATVVTFPDSEGKKFTMSDLDKALVPLRDIDPAFKPDLTGAGSIARVLVRSGKLQAFTFNGVNPVQWTIESGSEPLEITATSDKRSATIRLKSHDKGLGTEVVLANAPDLLSRIERTENFRSSASTVDEHDGHGNGDEPHHFTLYNKIRRNGASADVKLPLHRMTLPSTHGFFKALQHMKVDTDCTGTCCAK